MQFCFLEELREKRKSVENIQRWPFIIITIAITHTILNRNHLLIAI